MCSMAWFSRSSTPVSFPFDPHARKDATLPDPTSCARSGRVGERAGGRVGDYQRHVEDVAEFAAKGTR